jgi:hypothetical protein
MELLLRGMDFGPHPREEALVPVYSVVAIHDELETVSERRHLEVELVQKFCPTVWSTMRRKKRDMLVCELDDASAVRISIASGTSSRSPGSLSSRVLRTKYIAVGSNVRSLQMRSSIP